MEVKRMLVPDHVWTVGWIRLAVPGNRFLGELRLIDWPLPRDRVHEVAILGDTTCIFLRASEFEPRLREGEPDGG